MLRITDFTQTETGLAAPHLIVNLGQDMDLGPITAPQLEEFQAAAAELLAQYRQAAIEWAALQSARIAADIAHALNANPAYTEVISQDNQVTFVYHGVYFGLFRVADTWRLTWDAPIELNWGYDLPTLAFSGAAVAAALQAELDNLRADYPAPAADEQAPTSVERRAALWVLHQVHHGGSFTGPAVAAVFNSGKYEYQPVRLPAVVLEILRQWPNCARPLRRQELNRLAQWYLAYGPYLQEAEAPIPPQPLPTSVFLQ